MASKPTVTEAIARLRELRDEIDYEDKPIRFVVPPQQLRKLSFPRNERCPLCRLGYRAHGGNGGKHRHTLVFTCEENPR